MREADDAFVCACEAVAEDDLAADAAALPPGLARRDRDVDRRAGAARAPARGARARAGTPGRSARCCWRAPDDARAAWDAALAGGAVAIGAETRETLRIEHGVPRFGVDFDGSNLPAEAGVVERAVSFTKGCYIGQEPIVRLAHRGHANRELHRLRLDEPPVLPATLLDGEREVGPPDEQREPARGRRGGARLRAPRGRRRRARSSRSTPGEGASRLGTLVEWPQGARSSGDRAQPCGG